MTEPIETNNKKRKLVDPSLLDAPPPSKRPIQADTYSRIASNSKGATKSGRGVQAGWTHCPLCFPLSAKVFARGRGVASHLHAVHTPWQKPSKAEQKRRRREEERKKRQPKLEAVTTENKDNSTDNIKSPPWEPSAQEVEEWNCKVLRIVQELDDQPLLPENSEPNSKLDRQEYRSSLPPFLQAAADGNLAALKQLLESKTTPACVLAELNRTDRHLSIAEHWAAGGGHLDCLKWLLETRNRTEKELPEGTSNKKPTKLRRRDGKTALHYAARNGKVDCIDCLLRQHGHAVDEVSGDGTTPLHLACYGGHLQALKSLLQTHGANAQLANEWNCTAAHWMGMTKSQDTEAVRTMCRWLQDAGVHFVQRQKQGHTAVHKAAQRKNKHVIQWLAQTKEEGGAGLSKEQKEMAGQPDEGGHSPSSIWFSVGGDPKFGEWMKNEMGW